MDRHEHAAKFYAGRKRRRRRPQMFGLPAWELRECSACRGEFGFSLSQLGSSAALFCPRCGLMIDRRDAETMKEGV